MQRDVRLSPINRAFADVMSPLESEQHDAGVALKAGFAFLPELSVIQRAPELRNGGGVEYLGRLPGVCPPGAGGTLGQHAVAGVVVGVEVVVASLWNTDEVSPAIAVSQGRQHVLGPCGGLHVRVLVEHDAVERRALDALRLVHADDFNLSRRRQADAKVRLADVPDEGGRHQLFEVVPVDALGLVPGGRGGDIARPDEWAALDGACHEATLADYLGLA